MNDVSLAKLRRIKLPNRGHADEGQLGHANGAEAFAASGGGGQGSRRHSLLFGDKEERYVFTRTVSHSRPHVREVMPTGYKSFFRSLKQKHGFKDKGEGGFNLKVTLPEVKRPARQHRRSETVGARRTSPSPPRRATESSVSPTLVSPPPNPTALRPHSFSHQPRPAPSSHQTSPSPTIPPQESSEPLPSEEVSSPPAQMMDMMHMGKGRHTPKGRAWNPDAVLADMAHAYLSRGEPPRCSPLAHKESSLVNPDVTEEEELGLVGIHDAMDEEGVVARPRSERDQHREDPNSEAHKRKHMELQQAETRRRMEHFMSVVVPALSKLGPYRSWRQWTHYVRMRRQLEFRWGWREVSKEEACFLFQKRFARLRKAHLRRGLIVWSMNVEHIRAKAVAKRVAKAQVVIQRNVVRWFKAVKAEQKHQAELKVLAKKRLEMDTVLRFEREARKLRAIHHFNKARSLLECSSATLIQKIARRYIALKHARIQRRRKHKAEWRYREWRRQWLAQVVIRRAFFYNRGRKQFERRVSIRKEEMETFEVRMLSATKIQKAYHSMVDRREGKELFVQLRLEKVVYTAGSVIARAWHNAMHIRYPINRRADARQQRERLRITNLHARNIQRAYRRHHNYAQYLIQREKERERRRKMPGAATTIACYYRRHVYRRVFELQRRGRLQVGRRVLQRLAVNVLRQRIQERRAAAAVVIQLFWYGACANQEAEERVLEKRRVQEEEGRRKDELRRLLDTKSRVIQRVFRVHRFRVAMHRRVVLRIESTRHLHDAAITLQHNIKRYMGNKWLYLRFLERKRIMELAFMNKMATILQKGYRGYRARYYAPSRLILRRQMEIKRRQDAAARLAERRNKAAKRIQQWYKRLMGWRSLYQRFRMQKLRLDRAKENKLQHSMALRIQVCWQRIRGHAAFKRRCRDRKAATKIQRSFRKFRSWKFLDARFVMRRKALDVQYQLAAEKNKAQEEEEAAQAARKVAEDELAYKISRSWKLGADSYGRNYYFNWITNESRWDKPEGWEPSPEETWIKNVDDRGNVYYYHILTGESRWLPPCTVCFADAQRFCVDCSLTFCHDHFDTYHDDDEKRDHEWRGADTDKDNLQAGEVFCIECRRKAAKRVCKTCKDPYCERCYETKHSSGWLSTHQWVSYADSRKGWQTVPGRTPKDPPYYFNASTGQSTYEKPRELMSEDELAEHDRFMSAKEAAERYAKRIEELQLELEALQYKMDLKWAEDMEKQREMDELRRELEHLQKMQKNFWDALLDNLLPWRVWWRTRQERADSLTDYRKKLLVSRKEREAKGVVLGEDKKRKNKNDYATVDVKNKRPAVAGGKVNSPTSPVRR